MMIRQTQMNAFAEAAREQFVTAMVLHVKRYFPSQRARLGSDIALRRTVAQVVKKAEDYGFKTRRDVCKFINVAMMFGVDFDQTVRPLADILSSCGCKSRKARRLNEAALALHRKIRDLGEAHFRRSREI